MTRFRAPSLPDRLQVPHDPEAEDDVLGAALLSQEACRAVVGQLRPDDFLNADARSTFVAICRLAQAGDSIDHLTVKDELRRTGTLDSLKEGPLYIAELTARVPLPTNYPTYIRIVAEQGRRRRIVALGSRLVETASNGQGLTSLDALVAEIQAASVETTAEGTAGTSWAAVDLEPILDGRRTDPAPALLRRTDGSALLYPGRLHTLAGEPEAGKGWLVLAAVAERLSARERVLYLDFEDTPASIVERLEHLSVQPRDILELLTYIHPDAPLRGDARRLVAPGTALVVVDGVTEAMSLHGLKIGENDDVAQFRHLLSRRLTEGEAVVLEVDHVTKDREGRGRWAIGAQHKLAGADVAFSLEMVVPFGRGREGLSRLTITKDRPGFVRAVAAPGGKALGVVRYVSHEDESVEVVIEPASGGPGEFRPTRLMEKVSRHLEIASEPPSQGKILSDVSGKRDAVRLAIARLVAEGYVDTSPGPRKSILHTSTRPYRELEETDP